MTPSTATHEITNQSPAFAGINLFATDTALANALVTFGGKQHTTQLEGMGQQLGSSESFEMGRRANAHPPTLHRFDEKGHPADLIEFHPAYHDAMAQSIEAGLHCSVWEQEPEPAAYLKRLAGIYMTTQVEAGHVCPITMTNASVATIQIEPTIADHLLPKIRSRAYDARVRPIAEKQGITVGMGMTEKQGGTDVRANTTTAQPTSGAGPGREYILNGHKWFLSAPMCDAFLMLAQADEGLSCFFVPRLLPDGHINPIRLQRLKHKLGNRSNASSEVELERVHGWLIGEEGRGVANIIEMVTMTRLDCAVASAGQMRLAIALATHHCRHRRVFQKHLIDHPLMAQVLADMALDVEAATWLSFRLARSFEEAGSNPSEAAWRRLMTPVTKYWACKLAPAIGYEALECMGGNGYVEDGLAARLYREMPLNAIWEGSGNVMCLDVLRVLQREPETLEIVLNEILALAEGSKPITNGVNTIMELIRDPGSLEKNGRILVEALARTAAAALLVAHTPTNVSDPFTASRLSNGFHHTYGAGTAHHDTKAILDRTYPPST